MGPEPPSPLKGRGRPCERPPARPRPMRPGPRPPLRGEKKSPACPCEPAGLNKTLGNDLLSHRVTPTVPSALEGLTTVFGMGTGVSPPPWSPNRGNYSQTTNDSPV